jgi:hypothetical protein
MVCTNDFGAVLVRSRVAGALHRPCDVPERSSSHRSRAPARSLAGSGTGRRPRCSAPRSTAGRNRSSPSSASTNTSSLPTINIGCHLRHQERALPTQRPSWREGSHAFTNARILPTPHKHAARRPTARTIPRVPKSSFAQHSRCVQRPRRYPDSCVNGRPDRGRSRSPSIPSFV